MAGVGHTQTIKPFCLAGSSGDTFAKRWLFLAPQACRIDLSRRNSKSEVGSLSQRLVAEPKGLCSSVCVELSFLGWRAGGEFKPTPE
jgi:hypothetical protein